jgi:hypothetical protein
MHEGDAVELLKVGCAGWWYIKLIGKSIRVSCLMAMSS